jgi:hypothetical protein
MFLSNPIARGLVLEKFQATYETAKLHRHVHDSCPLVRIPSQINPVHILSKAFIFNSNYFEKEMRLMLSPLILCLCTLRVCIPPPTILEDFEAYEIALFSVLHPEFLLRGLREPSCLCLCDP